MPKSDPKRPQPGVSRKQLHRMAAIVTLLKRNEWVKMRTILKHLAATEFEAGMYLGCVERTVQRNIKILKDDYHAPIEYDMHKAAYRLLDPTWTFQIPALLSPEQILAVVIGGKICRDIFPSEISSRVSSAVNEIVRYNESNDLAADLLNSLKVLTDDKAAVSNEVFLMVFEAWRTRHMLTITYSDANGVSTTRDIEPHALVFFDMRWSIKGYCHLRQAIRTFSVSQIMAAVMLDKTFVPSKEIIDSVTIDSFLDYEQVDNVSIRLNDVGHMFALAHPLHTRQSIVRQDDGKFLLFVPQVPLERLVPWILDQQGNAMPEAPVCAVDAVRKAIRSLTDAC